MRVRWVVGCFIALTIGVGGGFAGCGSQSPPPAAVPSAARPACAPGQEEVDGVCKDVAPPEPSATADAAAVQDASDRPTDTTGRPSAAPVSVKPVAIADVDLMCALMIGCADVPVPVPTRDHGACVREILSTLSSPAALKFSLTVRECGLRSGSCQQFRECALRGADPQKCVGRGVNTSAPVGFCDLDGRAVRCWHGKVYSVRDCPRGTESCAVRGSDATCILGPCSEDAGWNQRTCSADGQRILQCVDGKVESISCAAFGLGCEIVDGKPLCVATSSPRCTSATRRCDGSNAVECVDGHEVRVECGAQGLSCATSPAKGALVVGSCVAPEPSKAKCDPSTFDTRCDGAGAVQYCAMGTVQKVFCKALGLNRCVAAGNAAHCE